MKVWSTLKIWVLATIFISCAGYTGAKEHLLTGRTMGTTYKIKIIAPANDDMDAVHRQISNRLEQLNQSMSTYRDKSEISRFNKTTAVGQPFVVSADFLKVMLAAETIYELTQGAWDGTVNPLVDLWGFGRSGPIGEVPSSGSIKKAMENVGFKYIHVSAKGFLTKHRSRVTVNLASIAKGYGVDMVAQVIAKAGYNSYLVEIGGEVFARGRRLDGKVWRVGVNLPLKTATTAQVYKAVPLDNRAMATSGDYRNFVEIGGRTYSHVLDPRTGYPVTNGVVSVSVIAPNCTLADGLATALMVLGPTEGIVLLDNIEKVEGLIIVRQPDGRLQDHWSRGIVNAEG